MNRMNHIVMRRRLLNVTGGLLLSLTLALPAHAQNQCGSGAALVNPLAAQAPSLWRTVTSWLGRQPLATEGGVGGTGAMAARPGIGGTGISDGGVGGTGIVGIITGFASICVNGLEVQFDATTPVTSDGQPGSVRQLAVGQVVAVRAALVGDVLSAQRIAVIHAAIGPIEAPNVKTGEFRILGQTARALDPGDLVGVKPGSWARISGHRQAQGEIAASRIEPIAPQAQAQLQGSMSRVAAEGLRVGSTPIQFGTQPIPTELARGGELMVSGQWDGRSLHVNQVRVDPTRKDLGAVERFVYEGYIHTLDAGELDLGRGPLAMSAEVQIVGGGSKRLSVNHRVRVSGRLDAEQRVKIDRIEFRDHSPRSGKGIGSKSKRHSGSIEEPDSADDDSSSESSGSFDDSGSSSDSDTSGRSTDTERSGSSGSSGGSGHSGHDD